MDIEKSIADQNYVLGEIKAKVDNVIVLQTVANGRTGKLEAKVEALELSKSKLEGQLSSLKWVGAMFVIVIGIAEFIVSHYWK